MYPNLRIVKINMDLCVHEQRDTICIKLVLIAKQVNKYHKKRIFH